jgi:thiopurine S-methyltransferase
LDQQRFAGRKIGEVLDFQFWLEAWNEGGAGFHRKDYHEKLIEFFPQLNPEKGKSVLVPLCGKSKDLIWLHGLGLKVHGVEFHEQPVKSFFDENKLSLDQVSRDQDFTHYTHENIVISHGDFFKLNESNAYDFVYDRASLVALPPEMRKNYANVIARSLKKGGKYLLVVFEYDQSEMEGPPFSIGADEIRALYQDQFSIRLMESQFSAVESLHQKVYILEKMLNWLSRASL